VKRNGNDELWIFGGNDHDSFHNDMYYFSITLSKWFKVPYNLQKSMAIPTPRSCHSMVYFEHLNQFFLFGGGANDISFNDLFIFDVSSSSWIIATPSGEPPAVRASHSASKINDSTFIVIGGGNALVCFNDVFLYSVDNDAWTKIKITGE
jgi:hypothetical protein